MRKVKNLRWYMLGLLFLGTVVNYLDRNTLGVLAPVLRQELNFSTEQYSYIVSAFQFCYALMQPLAGVIVDYLGLRAGYGLFILLWGITAAAHAFSSGWLSMAVFRGALGITEAGQMPSAVKMCAAWFPAKERSIATGWFTSGTSIGAMIAPPVVIWLSLAFGWKMAFLITGLIGVAMAGVWFLIYRNPEVHSSLSEEERAYIIAGQPQDEPVAKPRLRELLGLRQIWALSAARFLTEPAWQTFSFWIPLYMVSSRGMDLKQFALFGWMPFLAADLGAVCSGYVSNFFHRNFRVTLENSRFAGIGVATVCMVGPGLIGLVSSPFTAILLFSIGGFAHQMLSSLLYAVVIDNFPKQQVATATGFAGMCGWLGGFLFTLVIGQLAEKIGYEPLFAMLPVFDFVALAIVVVLLGRRPVFEPRLPGVAAVDVRGVR